jgi:hypothetical protein
MRRDEAATKVTESFAGHGDREREGKDREWY